MTIGILRLSLFIHNSGSLKEKRMVLNSLKTRLRNAFNVSVAEIDTEDKWQKATLAVVGVGKSKDNLNSCLSDIVNYIDGISAIHLINYEMEMI